MHHEVLDPQASDALDGGRQAVARDMGDQSIPEDAPDDSGVLGHALLIARQGVEACRQHGLDRAWDLDLVDRYGQLPVAICEP